MSKRRDVDSWSAAWSQRYPEQKQSRHKQSRRLRLPFAGGRSSAGRYALASAVVLAVAVTPFAVAQTTSGPQSFAGDSARYVLLARNTRTADGGAGAMACNSNTGNEPCLNMVNKGNGFAAAFRTRGLQGFRLQTSGSGTATPFVLDKNATGLVKFLNADTVDGKSADEIGREPWATVSVTGTTVTLGDHNGATSATRSAVGDYRVVFSQDVSKCSFQGTPTDQTAARTVAASPDPANPMQVRVTVRAAAAGSGVGAPADGDPVDDGFQIAVFC